MLQVKFPAPHSLFLNESAIMRRYSFWEDVKNLFTRPCYPYPVVYTDGLISRVISDGDSRLPWGIAIGIYVIAIDAPQEEMSIKEATQKLNELVFAGRPGTCVDFELMRYICHNVGRFNRMIRALGGTPFTKGTYISTTIFGKPHYVVINFAKGHNAFRHLSKDEKNDKEMVYYRPAIYLPK